jgi:hypothetical protein
VALVHVFSGQQCSAVQVSRYTGLLAIKELAQPGPVIVAGRTLVFLTRPLLGADDILTPAKDVTLPPADRRSPPGAYWLARPRQLIEPATLKAVIQAVLRR